VSVFDTFRLKHAAGAADLLSKSVQSLSSLRYGSDWNRYMTFFSKLVPFPTDNDYYLLNLRSRDKINVLLWYIHYAYVELKLKAVTVVGSMSGIRHWFRTNCYSVDIFENATIMSCKNSILLMDRANGSINSHRKYPLTLAMIKYMLKCLKSIDTMEHKMLMVGIQLAFCCMLRPSEYLYYPKKALLNCDHSFKAKDILFEVLLRDNAKVYVDASCVAQYTWEQIILVKFVLRSCKNDRMRAGKIFWFPAACTPNTISIAKVAYDWSVIANLSPESVFLSHRSNDKSDVFLYLKDRSVRLLIKNCARVYKFDPMHFSPYSLRIGGACHLRASNASDSMIQFLGRWKSLTCCLSYQESSMNEFAKLQDMFADENLFTTDDIRRMHPVQDTSS
jgi:hypothetical protein